MIYKANRFSVAPMMDRRDRVNKGIVINTLGGVKGGTGTLMVQFETTFHYMLKHSEACWVNETWG